MAWVIFITAAPLLLALVSMPTAYLLPTLTFPSALASSLRIVTMERKWWLSSMIAVHTLVDASLI